MHLAASENQLEIVKFLLAAGVDANPIDRWGGRPLDDALRQGHQRVVDLLKQHGGKGGKRDRRPSIFGSPPMRLRHRMYSSSCTPPYEWPARTTFAYFFGQSKGKYSGASVVLQGVDAPMSVLIVLWVHESSSRYA